LLLLYWPNVLIARYFLPLQWAVVDGACYGSAVEDFALFGCRVNSTEVVVLHEVSSTELIELIESAGLKTLLFGPRLIARLDCCLDKGDVFTELAPLL
jgi:hypothetical protein